MMVMKSLMITRTATADGAKYDDEKDVQIGDDYDDDDDDVDDYNVI